MRGASSVSGMIAASTAGMLQMELTVIAAVANQVDLSSIQRLLVQ